jgi:hypothetical protein
LFKEDKARQAVLEFFRNTRVGKLRRDEVLGDEDATETVQEE